jgi:hypothetical protein
MEASMAKKSSSYGSYGNQPMRIQARPGSLAEQRYYRSSGLPKGGWPKPTVIAPGISPKPLDDLIYHGGKLVPQMEFQNIYLGGQASWQESDIESIDAAITMAMQDRRLNNVIKQYFVDVPSLTCDPRPSVVLEEASPKSFDEPDVQATVVRLCKEKKVSLAETERTKGTALWSPLFVAVAIAVASPTTAFMVLGWSIIVRPTRPDDQCPSPVAPRHRIRGTAISGESRQALVGGGILRA